MTGKVTRNLQYYKFCFYGFFKNLRFFDAFLILFLLEQDLTYIQIGLLYSVKEIVLALVEIPSGIIADALGRRSILMVAFASYILSFVVFYFAESYAVFMAAMLIFSFADAFRTGVHKAMIYHYLEINGWKNQKIRYYGHTRSWSQMGTALSSLLAGFLVFYSDNFRIVFLASIIPYVLGLILVTSYPSYLDGDISRLTLKSLLNQFKTVISAFWKSLSSLSVFKVLINGSIYTGYYRAVKDYIQPLLQTLALAIPVFAYLSDKDRIAIMVGVFYFLAYLLTAVASRKSGAFVSLFKDSLKPMNLTITIGFAVGTVVGLFFVSGWMALAVVLFILILIIENLRKPIGFALVTDESKQEAYASVLSTSSQAKSLISAGLALVLGLLANYYGPGIAIAATSIGLLLSLPLYWLRSQNQ